MDHERIWNGCEYADDAGYMSKEAYDQACYLMVERSQNIDGNGMILRLSSELGYRYLVVIRPLLLKSPLPSAQGTLEKKSELNDEEQAIMIEDEDEAAVHHFKVPAPVVEYNVLLSPIYRVPVLYFFLRNVPPSYVQGLNAVYSFLVPQRYRSGLRDVGVMGGISMSNHPVTDTPVYFIHPCNTAEAMRQTFGNRRVPALQYLQIWMGMIGEYVGLNVTKELGLKRPDGFIDFDRCAMADDQDPLNPAGRTKGSGSKSS